MYEVVSDKISITELRQKNANLVKYSLFKELNCPIPFKNFSIKFVSKGVEQYDVNGNRYRLQGGEYLLANELAEGFVLIESENLVKGICIDINTHVLTEALASNICPDTLVPDIDMASFFNSNQFIENKYHASKTNLGYALKELEFQLTLNPFDSYHFQQEFYFEIAQKLIDDYKPIIRSFSLLKACKLHTKKLLCRKLAQAKDFIDDHYLCKPEVEFIARECQMSEFHFFRLFKIVYGISPHQYIIKKKLEYAKLLMKQKDQLISQIALSSGFSDVSSFTKSFKKHNGKPPSLFKRLIQDQL